MKTKRITFEATGVILGLLGAFSLVASLLPLINPGLAKVHHGEESFLSISSLLFLVAALLIIGLSLLCSQIARKLKELESATIPMTADKTEKPD
jgi:hypothetical protein